MKKRYYLLIASVAFVSIYAVLQTDSRRIENEDWSIEAELEKWDPIRGVWLAESLEAMSENRTIPDRMFPEDLTPYQMISLLPNELRNKVERSFGKGELQRVNNTKRVKSPRKTLPIQTSDCGTISARTYGDPHLVTYDGARYSFQTVGEFVLTKSSSGMEIQTRQKPEGENFSLNTAVAMNVRGDRVALYASDYPDGDSRTPLRVNGKQVKIEHDEKHFLAHGGVVRKDYKGHFIVDWPTGESATVKFGNTSNMNFLNVNTSVSECGQYNGLLGNANGIIGDDFGNLNDQEAIRIPEGSDIFTGSSQEIKQSRLAYIANALGDEFRVTPFTSLFDYPAGASTHTFTDRSFPRVHKTLEEVPQADLEEARKRCREEAIANNDMNGCIYDQVYLDIEPEPVLEERDPTEGIILRPIQNPVPNVNTGSGGTVTGGNSARPNLDPIKDERKPVEEERVRDPKEEASKDSRYKEEQIQFQQELEEQNRKEERLREEQAEQVKQENEEREKEARLDRLESERREYEREQEREQEAQEQRDREERANREKREREEQEAREDQERIEKEEAYQREQDKRDREERMEREKKEEEERIEREKEKREERAKAEAQRKQQEEARKRKEAAEKKAREEAARKAKEAADKKRREEAAKNTRGGR